ncbi:transporter substrate-binding protein [Cypionkella psychrotolerans]|uniref:transporter substrate-binding protein n=1 Tax=Cypionkella psychrotolerans TaxID=1678131 RepID=UPI0006B5C1C1|nr:transporter substrate-binding protein [Cypionkella psychrotolerans]
MKRRVELGLLHSRSGSYALMSKASLTGALAAIDAVNADAGLPVYFTSVQRDPCGNADAYGPLCEEILRDSSARHVVGCVTSLSRKEVIPSLEKLDGTLWYPLPYEGFEASDRVIYTHACPNQHLLPLLDWAMPAHGRRVYLTGSNYIWGWEINRLARMTIVEAGGVVLGERYLPIGATDVERMIDEIRVSCPDFVLNSLVGASSYAFLRAYHALSLTDPRFTPERCPMLSCNLTECEFPPLGAAAEGLISAGPYFRGISGWQGQIDFGSSHEAASYGAVTELARLLAHHGPGSEHLPLAQLLAGAGGMVDAGTHHTRLPVIIAQVRNGAFEVIQNRGIVVGDPFLSRDVGTAATPLRVVS